jgi:protein tyrosine/serine phosphatase
VPSRSAATGLHSPDGVARPWFLPAYYAMFELASGLRAVAFERRPLASMLGLRHLGTIIERQVYRASEPRSERQWAQVERLAIRTLLCVKRTPMRAETRAQARARGLVVLRVDLGADAAIDPRAVEAAALLALDPSNGPVLVHCDGGRHRAGIVGACIRRLQGWTLAEALAEYERLARPTPRAHDRAAIVALW